MTTKTTARRSARRYGPKCAYASPAEEARIRFNQGYHDGAHSQRTGTTLPWERTGQPHFCPAYQTGYASGRFDAERGWPTDRSTAAFAAALAVADDLRIERADAAAPDGLAALIAAEIAYRETRDAAAYLAARA